MLWFPIMLNDDKIGDVGIRRLDQFEEGKRRYRYEWEAQWKDGKERPGEPPKDQKARRGTILHDYHDGPMVLIQKVLERVL